LVLAVLEGLTQLELTEVTLFFLLSLLPVVEVEVLLEVLTEDQEEGVDIISPAAQETPLR